MVRRIWRNTKWREKNSHVHVKPYQWAYPSGFSVIYRVFVRNDNMICMLRKERMIDESGMLRFDINRARCEQHHCCMVYGRMIAKPWQRQQQQQQPATGTMSMWGRSPSLLCACKNTMFFFYFASVVVAAVCSGSISFSMRFHIAIGYVDGREIVLTAERIESRRQKWDYLSHEHLSL